MRGGTCGAQPQPLRTADPTLRQALGNLTDNAEKYAPEGAVTVSLAAHSGIGKLDAVLSVLDSGPGFSAASLEHLSEFL